MSFLDTACFQGGGVKGIAYCGVLKCLHDRGHFDNIKRVVGTSVGSIIAMLFACGYDANEISEVMSNVDYSKMEDNSWFVTRDIYRLVTNFGYNKGTELKRLLEEMVKKKTGSKTTTLLEMQTRSHMQFTCVSVDIAARKVVLLNHETAPSMPIALAVLSSCSVPFIFPPVRWGKMVLIDGGCTSNFPIDVYEGEGVVGFRFKPETDQTSYPIDNIVQYSKGVINSVLAAASSDFTSSYVVEIPIDGVSALDFDVNASTKSKLVQNGFKATAEFLDKIEITEDVLVQTGLKVSHAN
jgi:NTE family protein